MWKYIFRINSVYSISASQYVIDYKVSGALTAGLTTEMLDSGGLWTALRKLHEWRSIASGILKREASFSRFNGGGTPISLQARQ